MKKGTKGPRGNLPRKDICGVAHYYVECNWCHTKVWAQDPDPKRFVCVTCSRDEEPSNNMLQESYRTVRKYMDD